MALYDEILEQPDSLERLLHNQRQVVVEIARQIQRRNIHFVFLAARGSSDNAGRYANYLWGAMNHLPVALATPSLFTYYHQPPVLNNALVVGVSQSGQSPDIVGVLEEARSQGCLTLTITNTMGSPLAQAAELVLDIQAGTETAVAATKTYSGQLMATAMLSVALSERDELWDELAAIPGYVRQVIRDIEEDVKSMVQRYRYMQHCVVIGRGYNYATAFEWSLKLKELTYVVAEPYSSADFLHGPIAMVAHGFPIMAVAPAGKVFNSVAQLLGRLSEQHAAELVVISNEPRALELAQCPIPMPQEIPEWLSPLVAIVPAQLFAYHLTCVKGFDPEAPRTIQKITETE